MIKQNVNIVNFNSLYEILNEIKENLPFNIIRYENEEDFIKQKFNNLEKSLTITNSKYKDLPDKNLLIFNNLPISIINLVELININLIKIKFNNQSKINIKGYDLNLNSKFFSKNNIVLKLTEKEIEIILYLNNNAFYVRFRNRPRTLLCDDLRHPHSPRTGPESAALRQICSLEIRSARYVRAASAHQRDFAAYRLPSPRRDPDRRASAAHRWPLAGSGRNQKYD